MRLRRYALSLLIMAATITSYTTQQIWTADEVIANGGEGECHWRAGSFGDCSDSCDGSETREVFCQCNVSVTMQVRATSDNCVRDDPRIKPLRTRYCGSQDCAILIIPTTTQSPTIHPVCRWTRKDFSVCSATCEGTQTGSVTCICTLSSGTTTTVSDDVCDSEDPRIRPQPTRSCGAECPTSTSPPETTPSPPETTPSPPETTPSPPETTPSPPDQIGPSQGSTGSGSIVAVWIALGITIPLLFVIVIVIVFLYRRYRSEQTVSAVI